MRLIGHAVRAGIVLAGILAATAAVGQGAYPNKPLRLVIPFAPGGASDFVGRIMVPRWTELLGQNIVVDNKAGASGNIGLEQTAARAPADGYTLFLGNVGTIAINPNLFKTSLPVVPMRDFVPITQVVDVPSALVAHPSFAPNNVKEMVTYVKSFPGKFNFASPGHGSANRLEMERFMKQTGTAMVHIPYKGGAGPVIAALLAGETSVMFVTLSSAASQVRAGKLKLLAIGAPKRIDANNGWAVGGWTEPYTHQTHGVVLCTCAMAGKPGKTFQVPSCRAWCMPSFLTLAAAGPSATARHSFPQAFFAPTTAAARGSPCPRGTLSGGLPATSVIRRADASPDSMERWELSRRRKSVRPGCRESVPSGSERCSSSERPAAGLWGMAASCSRQPTPP